MSRSTPNTKAAKAVTTFRSLMAAGWGDETRLIDAAAESLGGDDEAMRIANMVWVKHFNIMGAN